ncbi:MAG: SIMPL domain-containing protein [Bacteroidia bacterium]
MKIKLILLLLIVSLINLNQSKAQNTFVPHIQLKGESNIKILPDLGIFYIQINATAKTEAECNERLNKLNDELMKRLKTEGFTPEQIKLTNYSISAEWDYKDGKSKKIGYKSYQDFRIEFKLDKKRILSVYNKLSENKSENVSINFGTDCSDELKKKTKNELIVLAIKDATQKAQLIAETTGNKLGNMEFIRYGIASNQTNFPMPMESKVAYAVMSDSNEERAENFSINEIEFTEEIEMSFMIVK